MRIRALWRICIGFLCFVLLVVYLIVQRYPLEWTEWKDHLSLRLTGAKEIYWDGFHGYRISYCEKKSNCACVLLIHDLADNALTWKKVLEFPEHIWRRVGVSKQLEIVALDLLGSGSTAQPQRNAEYQVRRQAHLLRNALMHHILVSECARWTLVGNGLGGWIGAWFALDWPQNVDRLILINSMGIRGGAYHYLDLLRSSLESSLKTKVPSRVYHSVVEHLQKSAFSEILTAQNEESFLDDRLFTLRLNVLGIPSLLLWGAADSVIPLKIGYQMREVLRPVVWREIPKCGHYPQRECPLPVIQAIADMIEYGKM